MARYGIATIFENHPVGQEFTVDALPLHLTHVDSFEVDLSAEELATKLTAALAAQKAFAIKALTDEMYGADKDIPVTTLELTPQLMQLHRLIMGVLDATGAVLKNPHFHNDNFSPHVSVYGDKRVAAGDSVAIQDISIAAKVSDADDASRRVLANITLA
ncbi:MAG TPA: 2'-5' RNA ligase family protein [Candidatus Saccharimonadales bacterium]|nr:2'-5' RNA ligase family protein [Candidatus Saccharimonadales bacterium]